MVLPRRDEQVFAEALPALEFACRDPVLHAQLRRGRPRVRAAFNLLALEEKDSFSTEGGSDGD
jgi:hypothetical protein